MRVTHKRSSAHLQLFPFAREEILLSFALTFFFYLIFICTFTFIIYFLFLGFCAARCICCALRRIIVRPMPERLDAEIWDDPTPVLSSAVGT